MMDFFEKHAGRLNTLVLLSMLIVPFFIYLTALYGSIFQVKLLLGLMACNMLITMKVG